MSERDWYLSASEKPVVFRSRLQGQTTLLRGLTLVGDRVLEHITAFTIDCDLCALESALEGVAVQLLQQSSTTSKANVVSSNPFLLELLKDLGNGPPVDTVALDDTDRRSQQLVLSESASHLP